jgi:hypothetical protein
MKEKRKGLEEMSAAVTRYYDSLTDEEIVEDRAWGDFAATQFPDERILPRQRPVKQPGVSVCGVPALH